MKMNIIESLRSILGSGRKNSELCKETLEILDNTYSEFTKKVKKLKKKELEILGNNIIRALNEYAFLLNSMKQRLKIEFYDEEFINSQKTNPELPLLIDYIPPNTEEIFKRIIFDENRQYINRLRQLENNLGPFINNPKFYKEIKEKFENEVKNEIENIKKQDENSYECLKDKIDNILKVYENLKDEPIIAGNQTARLGVIKLLAVIAEATNKLMSKLENICNVNINDNEKVKHAKKHAKDTIMNGIVSVLDILFDFLSEVQNLIDSYNTSNNSELPGIIDSYIKANVAIFYISDLKERGELVKLFIEYSNKKYEELPEDVKNRIRGILNNNNIPEDRMKYLWNNYVYNVDFKTFILNKNVITISC